jgi:hypothetical protein
VQDHRALQHWRRFAKETELVPMFHEVLLLTDGTRGFAARNFSRPCERVALGARPRELLKVGEVLHHYPLLLCRDGARAILLHQVQNSFAIFCLSAVSLALVENKILIVKKICYAKLANQRTTDDWSVREVTQNIAFYIRPSHILGKSTSRSRKCRIHLILVLLDNLSVLQSLVVRVQLVLPHAS